ncbi:2OG-Fe(II) oxygenase [Zeaxanthinibacter enoshimensis]|uniref:2OG-Fe(II) oxygenase n=1 Tax=Zeaxanthinibacter enoshimensis TaxID=392009 RepID=UPI00356845F4
MKSTMHTEPEIDQFENLINGFMEKGYGSCDDFLEPELINGLRDKLLALHQSGEMHPAGIGKNFDYKKNAEIRGDVIRWLDEKNCDPQEQLFFEKLDRFVTHLNSTCYTGINGYEFHYAYYAPGSFYKRHLDRFRSDKGRQFSFVIYLNDNWQETDGGEISLYLGNTDTRLSPVAGRVVFFKSDKTEHEVHIASGRPRLSIAGWLKKI